jgi:nucleoside-diphosphate-sugar epimerase
VLNQVLDTSLTPTFAPARSGEVRFSQANVSRAREVLGWEAQITLQEGLSRLMQAEYA